MASAIEADVAVVGAGPAGIAAACHAAEAGARVVVVDQNPAPGGQIWHRQPRGEPPAKARPWLDRLQRSGARVLAGAAVVDAEPGRLTADMPDGPLVVHAASIVLATGARERFLPFPGWTLPGAVGVGGAQALLKAGASFAGLRVVVGGTGPLLLPVAAALARAGGRVLLVAEQAPLAALVRFGLGLLARPGKLMEGAGYRLAFLHAPYALGSFVRAAHGRERVEAVTVARAGRDVRLECDVLACGYGLAPNLELPRLLGCRIEAHAVAVDAEQRTSVSGVLAAGEPTGVGGLDKALVEGAVAGLVASGRPEAARPLLARRDRERAFASALERAFAPRAELLALATDETIVCRCEDVPLGRLRRERSARQAKLATRAGMGPCQGRVCGATLTTLFGWEADRVRPPLQPTPLATLAAEALEAEA